MNNQLLFIQYLGEQPVFIDGFPTECKRSCEGSLHLYPRKLHHVSSDELEYLKEKRKDVFRHMRVHAKVKDNAPAQSQKLESLQADVVEKGVEEPSEDTIFSKKWKKKGKAFEGD